MDTHDAAFLRSILERDNRKDLAILLEGCRSAVIGSDQYGNYNHSILSAFVIYAPLDKYFKLKKLTKDDCKVILDSVLDLYPPEDYGPEIDSIKFRILKEDPNGDTTQQYLGKSIRVFLSYSSKDKELIGSIKECLEKYGLEIFIAHEDIKPSLEWQEVILENLDSTDIFIPVITENFHLSDWTDQESGIAFIKNKFIIPISVDNYAPYGFLSKFQALKFRREYVNLSCNFIIKTISENPRFTQALTDSLINILPRVWSFEEAGNKFKILAGLTFSKEQINEIIKHSVQNDQIYDSWDAQAYLKSLVQKHKHIIDKDLLGQLNVKLKTIL